MANNTGNNGKGGKTSKTSNTGSTGNADNTGKSSSPLVNTIRWIALVTVFVLCIVKVIDFLFVRVSAETQLIIMGVTIVLLACGAIVLRWFPTTAPLDTTPGLSDEDLQATRALEPEELEECMAVLAQTSLACIDLELIEGNPGILDSKLGGTPYLPPGFDYPYNTRPGSAGKPLRLLCQLNMEQLPRLDGFPEKGMLQFYVAYEESEDTYGLDFEHPTKQDAWRIVYHESLVTDTSLLGLPPSFSEDDEAVFPVRGELAIVAKLGQVPITTSDFRWGDFWENVFEPSDTGQRLKDEYAEDEILDAIEGQYYGGGSRIGGYPDFTQADPRVFGKDDRTVLLLQLDSYAPGGFGVAKSDISWGEAGVANFFIRPNDLRALDFSKVMYNWDCL
jgi:uncharacterized protein YwqG